MSDNRKNIDRITNKPHLNTAYQDVHNRSQHVRRDDDVIRTPKKTLYDIDYGVKWFIENEIQLQTNHGDELLKVPVIFANSEKWENVRKLGFVRDEKGKLQAPLVLLKRNNVQERENEKKLDINKDLVDTQILEMTRHNLRNRFETPLDQLIGKSNSMSNELFLMNVPRYVNVTYELLMWTDFTSQMNDLIDQMLMYSGMAWGNEDNRYQTFIRGFQFETINTITNDRIVRASTSLDVKGYVLSEQKFKKETLKKAYSIKKVSFDTIIDVPYDIFSTTYIPPDLVQYRSQVIDGRGLSVQTTSGTIQLDEEIMNYIIKVKDKKGIVQDSNTVLVPGSAAINPITSIAATKEEFDIFINGVRIDKSAYNWNPSVNVTQNITFDTNILGYELESDDTVIVYGRWQ